MGGGHAVFVGSSPTQAPVIAAIAVDKQSEPKILVDPNRELTTGCALSPAEEIWYESFDGARIQGWILKPSGFNPSLRYPLVVSMHGGPHSSYGPSFNLDLQQLADRGYVVLYTNPRASTGNGDSFAHVTQQKSPCTAIKN